MQKHNANTTKSSSFHFFRKLCSLVSPGSKFIDKCDKVKVQWQCRRVNCKFTKKYQQIHFIP